MSNANINKNAWACRCILCIFSPGRNQFSINKEINKNNDKKENSVWSHFGLNLMTLAGPDLPGTKSCPSEIRGSGPTRANGHHARHDPIKIDSCTHIEVHHRNIDDCHPSMPRRECLIFFQNISEPAVDAVWQPLSGNGPVLPRC